MTVRFRLDRVDVTTVDGEDGYAFPSPLTVLAGPVGVGKSTLFELVKYALGGNGLLAQVATEKVTDVRVEVAAGVERYALARSIDKNKAKVVRVTDLRTRERLPDHHVDGRTPSLSDLLLTALGFPTDLRAAARTTGSTNAGNRITFADLFSFMYVPQAEINSDIASSDDSYREPKRKSVFELFFRLTAPDLLRLRSELARTTAMHAEADREHQVIVEFLSSTSTESRLAAEAALQAAERDELTASTRLAELRDELDPVDSKTQTLRDLLIDAEERQAAAKSHTERAQARLSDLASERRAVERERERLARLRDAGGRLADIEFRACPRCLQSLRARDTPHGTCRLCLQSEPAPRPGDDERQLSDVYEERQLDDQLEELEDQALLAAGELDILRQQVQDREHLARRLSADIEERTRARVSPRLQAYGDATRAQAEASSRQRELDGVLRYWDRSDDVGAAAAALRAEAASLADAIRRAETVLAERRKDVLDELDAEFAATMTSIGVPGVQTAALHRTNYLPLLNGTSFKAFSPPGGIRTATQVAYWLTLLTVALRRRDTDYPTFLLVDSPRTALNNSAALSAALYSRIVTQMDLDADRLQIVIGDNELPSAYRRDYAQIDFTYASPTIASVPHPGPTAVLPLVMAEPGAEINDGPGRPSTG